MEEAELLFVVVLLLHFHFCQSIRRQQELKEMRLQYVDEERRDEKECAVYVGLGLDTSRST